MQLHQDAPFHLISKILVLELVQASRQHRRARDQHDRQRRLHHQQRLARERRAILRAPARPPQSFRGIGARGKPRGDRAEDDGRHQGQCEGERQNREGGHGADGKEVRAVEGEREQQARCRHRHHQTGQAAAERE